MTGYVRVDTSNNIADGNIISASDLDNEFDGVQAAFNASTGHNHDGTTGEGAPILVLGPAQDVVVGASTITPKTTNTVDIGSSSLKFKDLYLAGNASIAGTLAITGATTLSAALTYGGVTLNNAVTGTGNMVLSTSPTLVTPALGTPSSVTLTNATGLPISTGVSGLGTGIATFLATPSSDNLRSAVTDETGSGALVFATSPTLVTPNLGTPSTLVGTNITGTAAGLTAGNVTTNANLTGAVTSVGNTTSLGSFTSTQLAGALTDETGSGAAVFATSPTLVTPALGTPSSVTLTNATGLPISTGVSGLGTGVATALAVNVGTAGSPVINGGVLGTPSSGTLTNATGLPISTGVSGLGAGVATFLATPSSANLAAAVTDETGSGALVFATSPTLVTPALGTPSSVTLTNATGLPVATGISGLGTGIATALAVNVGSAGAPVLFNGALGTPSSGTVTNLTGTASININGTVGATTANTGAFTTLTTSSTVTLNGGTANGVAYLNGSKVLTSGSALAFNGTSLSAPNFFTPNDGWIGWDSSFRTRLVGNSSSNFLATIVDNSEQMRLTSTGLGIGTSSPARKLEVAAGTGGPALRLTNTNSNSGIEIITAADRYSWLLGAQYNVSEAFEITPSTAVGGTTFTTPTAVFTRSGNVGIGTSSPAAKIESVATISGLSGWFMAGQFTSANYPMVRFAATTPNKYSSIGNDADGSLQFFVNGSSTGLGSNAAILNPSGNLGLGVTPSAWGSAGGTRVVQVGSSGTALFTQFGNTYVGSNYFWNGTNDIFTGAGRALRYVQEPFAGHSWHTSTTSPGAGGGIVTFTQAMTLDASGRLGIGTTSPLTRLVVSNGSSENIEFSTGSVSLNGGVIQYLNRGVDSTRPDMNYYLSSGGGAHKFYTNDTERARIDSSGNLLVGTTSANSAKLRVEGGGSFGAYVSTDSSETMVVWNKAVSGNNAFVGFYTEGTLTSRGSITYNRAGGLVAYNTTSDYRAKDISGPVIDSGVLIDSTPVYMGKMKGATQERPMFIAHETPSYAHSGEKDAVDADGNPVYQQMDASALIPVMWAELKSLRQRLAAANL